MLYEVNRLACFANEYKDDAMMGRSAKVTENKRSRKQRELDRLLARDKELDGLFERLNEDTVLLPSTSPPIITASVLSPSLTAGKSRLRRLP